MAKHPHAGLGNRMVCDCSADLDHIDGCILGQAETIASEALNTAATGTHPLTAALIALTEAGMLSTVIAAQEEQLHDILMGLLDELYEAGLLIGRNC
jgi:hypothetical protein